MKKLNIMKAIFRFWLCLFLLLFLKLSMRYHHCYGQDLLALKTGEELEVKIFNVSRKYIAFYEWKDQGGKVHEVSRKFVKWYRPESWLRKKFSLSFSFGGVPYGTSTSLKKFMRDNGYSGNQQM